MRRLFAVLAASVVTLAVAQAAVAAPSPVTTIELQRSSADGSFGVAKALSTFTLAGVHWRGQGTVEFRTRSTGGSWSTWRPGSPEDEDGPDTASRERSPAGWRVGNPWWVGASDRIEVRSRGRVSRVRAHLVWSPEVRIPLRVPTAADAPAILPRSSWGADERIRRAPPSYATDVRFAVVHHTAGKNGYSRAEAAAIVKGIQLFHVQGNGWNDIGYNFLVDRFGTIYEGRFGGVERNVIGAHAQGFNTGSVGIALLGTYGDTQPSAAAQEAISRLVAWRLDVAHVDPTSFLTFLSGGSDRYASGLPVLLNAVSGHRDTGFTECPGNALYGRLGAIAASARATGGLKIFEPRAEVAAGSVRIRARLSQSQRWSVAVTSQTGAEVGRGAGTGTGVDWTWQTAGVQAGSYTWTVSAGTARAAAGIVKAGGGTTELAIESLAAEPEAISPNGDGQADVAAITYRLSVPANVSVEVVDEVGGVVSTVVDRVWTRAGEHRIEIDGASLADGSYSIVVTARTPAGASVQKVVPFSVNRTLGLVTVAPLAFSPNADGRRDQVTFTFALTAPATVRIRVERAGTWVASPLTASFLAGTRRFVWNGSRSAGLLRDGTYTAVVEADAGFGPISYGVPFSADTVAPRLRIVPGKSLRVEVSEPSVLTLVVNGRPVRVEAKRAGIVRIPLSRPATRVRAVAWDAAGNASAPAVWIKRAN